MFYQNKQQEVEVHATNMDEQLKMLAVSNWTAAIQFSIRGEMEECFNAYKALYHLIEPYDFPNKDQLKELTDTLTEFVQNFKSAGSQGKITKHTQVMLARQKYSFEQLLGIYMSELPKAYHALNLWFKSVKQSNDFDQKMSMQNFNTDHTSIEDKKKEIIQEVSVKQMMKLLTPNQIHDIYAKYRFDNAVSYEGDNNAQ